MALNGAFFWHGNRLRILTTKDKLFFNLYLAALGLFFLQTPKKKMSIKKLIRVLDFCFFPDIVFSEQQISKFSRIWQELPGLRVAIFLLKSLDVYLWL